MKVILAVSISALLVFTASGQQPSIEGQWNAHFADSLMAGGAHVVLGQELQGTYSTDQGAGGTIALKPDGASYRFILTQTVKDCPGSFIGTLTFSGEKATGTYTGSDCRGWHDNGVVSMSHDATIRTASNAPAARSAPGYVRCVRDNVVRLWEAPSSLRVVAPLKCNEPVTIISEPDGGFTEVRASNGAEGYVANGILVEGQSSTEKAEPTAAQTDERASQAIKEVAANTNIKTPERIVANRGHDDYQMSIRVLQTEQVPYTVYSGGNNISTSCSINGSVYTTGSAISSGNYTFGSATSTPSLTMNCNTYQTPPMGWRHVLNAMLAVGSNNMAYIIACDAAWRWSKCRGLVAGDLFRAKMSSKGMVVEAFVNGKRKEATYRILQMKVLNQ